MQRTPKIYTCFCTNDEDFEPLGDNPEIVDRTGYRNSQQQITELMMAGAMLEQFRAEAYDYKDDSEDDGVTMSPTREPNFDMSDATQLAYGVNERLNVQKDSKVKPTTDTTDTVATTATTATTDTVE